MGNTTMPQDGHPLRHRAGLRRRLGETAPAVRQAALERSVRARDLLRARTDIPVTEMIHETLAEDRPPSSPRTRTRRRVFLHDGATPKLGEIFRNPELAAALRADRRAGRRPPSTAGAIAKAILKTSDRLGGKMTAADLSEFAAEWVRADLHRLSRLEGLRAAAQRPGHRPRSRCSTSWRRSRWPSYAAARRRGTARADRGAEAGLRRPAPLRRRPALRPRCPWKACSRRTTRSERAKLIDPAEGALRRDAGQSAARRGRHHLSLGGRPRRQHRVADSERLPALRLGRGGGRLRLRPAESRRRCSNSIRRIPNALAPRKRPFHTIIPAFMEKGDVHIGFGIMGGLNQAQAHAQFVSQRGGPRHEHPGGARSAALHQARRSAAATC